MRNRILSIAVMLLLSAGCIKRVPVRPPPPVVQPPAPISPEGTWQIANRDGKLMKMLLKGNGEAVFQGGLEYLNPATWEWDPLRKKLVLMFPRAPDSKLEIFYIQVGHGVQYFDPARKLIAYRFDDDTSALNVAGWEFSKADPGNVTVIQEPTLR